MKTWQKMKWIALLALLPLLALAQVGGGSSSAGGSVIQSKSQSLTATFSGSGYAVPLDDTVPQSSEMVSYVSETITPTSATSIIEIVFMQWFEISTANQIVAGVFVGGAASASCVWISDYKTTTNGNHNVSGGYRFIAGGTSSITVNVRIGTYAAGNFYTDSIGGADDWGNTLAGYFIIREVAP